MLGKPSFLVIKTIMLMPAFSKSRLVLPRKNPAKFTVTTHGTESPSDRVLSGSKTHWAEREFGREFPSSQKVSDTSTQGADESRRGKP